MSADRKSIPGLSPIDIIVVLVVIAVLIALLWPSVQSSGGPGTAARRACKENLKQIGLALYNYHDAFGSFPPAFVADDRGEPRHSWRVLILPFLGEEDLYRQYRFDEPWDGPNNRKLLPAMPPDYRCRSGTNPDASAAKPVTTTSYVVVVGPRTMFPGDKPVRVEDISDERSRTVAVVEVVDSGIEWLEPRDLSIGEMAPTINAKTGQGISSRHGGGAIILRADGSVRFDPDETTAEMLKQMMTIDDGEPIDDL